MTLQYGRRLVLEIVDRAANATSKLPNGGVVSVGSLLTTIDTLESDFRVEFEYTKFLDNVKNSPTGVIKIHGLSAETVAGFGKLFSFVRLYCGYIGDGRQGLNLLFTADITEVAYEKSKGGSLCTLKVVGNQLYANNQRRIAKTYPEGTTKNEMFLDLSAEFGLNGALFELNDESIILQPNPYGLAVSGTLKEVVDSLCREDKLAWTIQADNTLLISDQFLNEVKQASLRNRLGNKTLVLNEDTGLIGLPYIKTQDYTANIEDSNEDNEITTQVNPVKPKKDGTPRKPTKKKVRKFGVEFQALINAVVEPNSIVEIQTQSGLTDGVYRVRDVKFSGDTRGNQWYMDCFAERPSE